MFFSRLLAILLKLVLLLPTLAQLCPAPPGFPAS